MLLCLWTVVLLGSACSACLGEGFELGEMSVAEIEHCAASANPATRAWACLEMMVRDEATTAEDTIKMDAVVALLLCDNTPEVRSAAALAAPVAEVPALVAMLDSEESCELHAATTRLMALLGDEEVHAACSTAVAALETDIGRALAAALLQGGDRTPVALLLLGQEKPDDIYLTALRSELMMVSDSLDFQALDSAFLAYGHQANALLPSLPEAQAMDDADVAELFQTLAWPLFGTAYGLPRRIAAFSLTEMTKLLINADADSGAAAREGLPHLMRYAETLEPLQEIESQAGLLLWLLARKGLPE